jgi:hypothetical protein
MGRSLQCDGKTPSMRREDPFNAMRKPLNTMGRNPQYDEAGVKLTPDKFKKNCPALLL